MMVVVCRVPNCPQVGTSGTVPAASCGRPVHSCRRFDGLLMHTPVAGRYHRTPSHTLRRCGRSDTSAMAKVRLPPSFMPSSHAFGEDAIATSYGGSLLFAFEVRAAGCCGAFSWTAYAARSRFVRQRARRPAERRSANQPAEFTCTCAMTAYAMMLSAPLPFPPPVKRRSTGQLPFHYNAIGQRARYA